LAPANLGSRGENRRINTARSELPHLRFRYLRAQGTNASNRCWQSKTGQGQEGSMHSIFYIIGVIVVVAFVLSFLGVL